MDISSFDSLPRTLQNIVTVRNLAAEQKLFWQGSLASEFFVITSGRFKIVRYLENNTVAVLGFAQPQNALGEAALFSDIYCNTAIAEIDSQVIVYPKSVLLSTLQDCPILGQKLIAILVKSNQSLQRCLELRDIRNAHQRLLTYLRYLARSSDSKIITLDRPLKEIAQELGFTPETLSRALAKLEKQGRITRSHNSIILQNSLSCLI